VTGTSFASPPARVGLQTAPGIVTIGHSGDSEPCAGRLRTMDCGLRTMDCGPFCALLPRHPDDI